MTKTLRLTLLGGLHIAQGEIELKGFVSRKAQALLVYLAVTGRTHFRDALAGLLWGNTPEKRAAGNLRVILSNLRRLVPDHVTITRRTVTFNRESDYWLDVAAFEGLGNWETGRLGNWEIGTPFEHGNRSQRQATNLPAQRAYPPKGRTNLPSLRDAVDLYRGDFLEGFYIRDAPGFEEWVTVERERLRQMIQQALHSLVQHHTARGEYTAGIEHATQLLALDPWREEAHRELMRLLALTGQRSAALAQYEECRRLLETELGLEPLEETKALYKQLANWETGRLGIGKLVDWDQSTRPKGVPFVGRGAEHATLVNWWETAQQGAGRLALVEGEAGVGKTRLVEEVVRYAQARGGMALRGRCYEFGGGVPYQPIVEALRSVIQYPISNLQPIWLAELSRLLPELRPTRPDLPEPDQVSDETARQRLFEAVARLFSSFLTSHSSLFIFLDDLHWADQSTLDLLHYLTRQAVRVPVWIVGTCRPEEMSLSHPLTRLRQGLGRDRLVNRLALEPLSCEAVGKLAQSLVGSKAGADLGDFLYQESEGNPFFLVETVSDLQEQGTLQAGEGGRWQWTGRPATKTLPAGVQDVILQRVGRTSQPAQRLLTLAAVIGRAFDLPLLQAAAGPDTEAVDNSLEEWLARLLVRHHPTSNTQYDLSHDKIRAVVYHAAGGRRPVLHRRVGEALEGLHTPHLEPVCEQLAHHFEQAGVVERALPYLSMAAAKATGVYANQEALDYYDRALALLEKSDERRWELLLPRGRVLRFLGRYEEAIATCQQVAKAGAGDPGGRLLAAQAANELSAIYRAHREYEQARTWSKEATRLAGESDERAEPNLLKERARARQLLGEVEREQGNLKNAERLFKETLILHQELANQRGVAECLKGLGHALAGRGRFDTGRQRLEEALEHFRALDDRPSEVACLQQIGLTRWRQGENDAAHKAFTEGLEIYQSIGDRRGEAHCLNNLGLAYIVQQKYDETQHCWEKSVDIYRSLGLEKRVSAGLHNLGILSIDQGDYDSAQRRLEESLAVNRAIGAKSNEALDLGWLGKLYLLRGEYQEAQDRLETAIALDQEIGGNEEAPWRLAWLGATVYERGKLAEAQKQLEQAIQLAKEQVAKLGLFELSWLVVVHLAQGEGTAALEIARQMLAQAKASAKPLDTSIASVLLGVAHGSGLVTQAEDPMPHFERAMAFLNADHFFLYGVALRRYGAYLARNVDREKGKTLLEQAQALFQRIGAKGELGKVVRLLAGDDAPRLQW